MFAPSLRRNSRLTDSLPAAKSAEFLFRLAPPQAACALLGSLTLLAIFCGSLTAADAKRPNSDTVREWQSRKYGMFIHFGLYSVLGGVWKGKQYTGNYSEQIQSDAKIPEDEYAALTRQFRPDRWDPEAIVRLAQDAGMRFIVITAKHHDGFSLFGTKASDYNVVNASPYAKDIVKGLAEASARHHMAFGVYYSTIDWHYGDVPDERNDNAVSEAHEAFNVTQLRELATGYGPLSEIWFDMGHPTKLQSKHFADTVHTYQPQCLVSGRVWNSEGDFAEMGDDEIPDFIQDEPWEAPASIFQETWGYRSWQKRTDLEKKIQEHIQRLVMVVSRGGNYILNIGPKGDGSVVDYDAAVLRGTGEWLKRNGEAIYGTTPQPFRKLDFGYATTKGSKLYLFVEKAPGDGQLKLVGMQNPIRKAYVLGDASGLTLESRTDGAGGSVTAPVMGRQFLPVVVLEFDGALKVHQPAAEPSADGSIVLTPELADHFYNRNNEGYYDPATVRKQRWYFSVEQAGAYRVEVSYKPGKFARILDVNVAGKTLHALLYGDEKGPAVPGVVELNASRNLELTIAPASPAERGAPLDVNLERVSLVPATEGH